MIVREAGGARRRQARRRGENQERRVPEKLAKMERTRGKGSPGRRGGSLFRSSKEDRSVVPSNDVQ